MNTQQATARGVVADDDIAQEIMRLEQQRVDAYAARDLATLERLLPDNFTFVRSVGSFGKRELLKLIGSGELTFESIDRRFDDVKVYLNSALALGQDSVRARYKEQDFSGHFRFSNMYVCTEGRWQVVATHSSLIEP